MTSSSFRSFSIFVSPSALTHATVRYDPFYEVGSFSWKFYSNMQDAAWNRSVLVYVWTTGYVNISKYY